MKQNIGLKHHTITQYYTKKYIPSQGMGMHNHTPPLIPRYHIKQDSEYVHDQRDTIGNISKIIPKIHSIHSNIVC